MAVTIERMAKTEQIRVPTDVTRDARICATELYGESLPEYVARVLREAVARDLRAAADRINERAKGSSDEPKRRKGQ